MMKPVPLSHQIGEMNLLIALGPNLYLKTAVSSSFKPRDSEIDYRLETLKAIRKTLVDLHIKAGDLAEGK